MITDQSSLFYQCNLFHFPKALLSVPLHHPFPSLCLVTLTSLEGIPSCPGDREPYESNKNGARIPRQISRDLENIRQQSCNRR